MIIKQFIAIIGIILAILSIYFGSLLPLVKAQRYITGLGAMSSIKTLEGFKENFDKAFNFYSPVGGKETAKFLGSAIINIIAQKEQSENVSRYLVEYIEPHLFKNNVRHLIMAGQMYFILWQKSQKESDFIKAENYYRQALLIGPNLPTVLYGLFDFYQLKGDSKKIREIAERILQYWPEDEKVKAVIR